MKPVLDVTRTAGRRGNNAPTGIDRVELAYAERFLSLENATFMRTTMRSGPQQVSRERIAALLEATRSRWSGAFDPTAELAGIEGRIARVFGVAGQVAAVSDNSAQLRGARNLLVKASKRLQTFDLADAVARTRRPYRPEAGQTYFHVSHTGLDRPERYRWLDRSGVRAVFMCHDIIPILYPEYVQPGARERHVRRIGTMARLADTVLADSMAARDELSAYLKARKTVLPRIVVSPLGVEPVWKRSFPGGRTFETPSPYFLCVGTIEARKNHAFLLTLWRELVAQHGRSAPILLIIGKRGWQVETARSLLEQCRGFDGHVHELGSVSDATLKVLLENAAGLLAPSFAEGFSYPPIEAMVSGTPIVASDIAVHREFLEGAARFVGPCDGEGWKKAIVDLSEASQSRSGSEASATQPGNRLGWSDHFSRVFEALETGGNA